MKSWSAVGLVFIATSAAIFSADAVRAQAGDDGVPLMSAVPAPASTGAFTTHDMAVHNARGTSFVSATLRNVTGRRLTEVVITFEVYDENGADLGQIKAHQKEIAAGGGWAMRALPLKNMAFSKAKISRVEYK